MADEARQKKTLTKKGMTTKNLARLIRDNGYRTREKRGADMDDLIRAIEAGRPPIVMFEVDKHSADHRNGQPATKRGKETGAHFAVIESVYTDEHGKRWLSVQHGWRERPYIFAEEDFVKSWELNGSEMIEIQNPYEQRAAK